MFRTHASNSAVTDVTPTTVAGMSVGGGASMSPILAVAPVLYRGLSYVDSADASILGTGRIKF